MQWLCCVRVLKLVVFNRAGAVLVQCWRSVGAVLVQCLLAQCWRSLGAVLGSFGQCWCSDGAWGSRRPPPRRRRHASDMRASVLYAAYGALGCLICW